MCLQIEDKSYLIPSFMLKVEIYDNPYNEHQSPGKEITVSPSQFRHPLEVHSPYPG